MFHLVLSLWRESFKLERFCLCFLLVPEIEDFNIIFFSTIEMK